MSSRRRHDRSPSGPKPSERRAARASEPQPPGTVRPGAAVALAVPCVDCGRPLAVMARTGGPEYLVELPAHEGPAGAACPGSGALCVVPPPAGRESVALALEGLERAEESAPAVEAPAPAAPPSAEPLPERMREYFLACPLSALLRIHRDVEAATSLAFELVALFEDPAGEGLEDPYHAPLDRLRQELEETLRERLRCALAAGHVKGNRFTFQDDAALERFHIPLEAVQAGVPLFAHYGPEEVRRVHREDPDRLGYVQARTSEPTQEVGGKDRP